LFGVGEWSCVNCNEIGRFRKTAFLNETSATTKFQEIARAERLGDFATPSQGLHVTSFGFLKLTQGDMRFWKTLQYLF
jgi:hypothetical protein